MTTRNSGKTPTLSPKEQQTSTKNSRPALRSCMKSFASRAIRNWSAVLPLCGGRRWRRLTMGLSLMAMGLLNSRLPER